MIYVYSEELQNIVLRVNERLPGTLGKLKGVRAIVNVVSLGDMERYRRSYLIKHEPESAFDGAPSNRSNIFNTVHLAYIHKRRYFSQLSMADPMTASYAQLQWSSKIPPVSLPSNMHRNACIQILVFLYMPPAFLCLLPLSEIHLVSFQQHLNATNPSSCPPTTLSVLIRVLLLLAQSYTIAIASCFVDQLTSQIQLKGPKQSGANKAPMVGLPFQSHVKSACF